MSKKIKILIIDDEQGIRNSLSEILIDEGYETLLADNAKAAKKIISDGHSFDLILLDIWMPDIDGITLLKELKTINHISQPIIMMSGHGTIDTAIDATKNGAYDFIEKPISLHKVLKVINQAINESLEFPAMTIDFLKKQDNQNIISIYNQLIKKKNKLILKTIYTDAVYSMLFELYKSNIYNIDQAQLRKVDDCDLFLEEKKNSTLIFEKILDFNSNTLSIFKIIESKLAKYNIKGVIVENTDLSDKNIEINLDNYELIDFKIFTKSDEDQLIKYSKQILNYYLDSVSNKIYKEFDITFLNKIRSDIYCYDLFYLDQIIRNSLKFSQSEIITDSDYEAAIKLNISYKKEVINQNPFEHLYGQDLKKARDEFEKIYFQHHIKNKLSMKELSEISGIERTHLYRKLKQLGIKNS